eukprot:310587_1
MANQQNDDESKRESFEEGDIVKMIGLKSKAHWNGKFATIIAPFVKNKNRWPIEINFGNKSHALLQAKNLKLESKKNTLRYFANKCFEALVDAFADDLYPNTHIEAYFGIGLKKGPSVKIVNDTSMPLGNVVYNAWITIKNNGQLNKKEIMDALCNGTLPKWFENKIRNNGNPRSYYAKALCDGDLFKQIQWEQLKININEVNVVEIQSNDGGYIGPLGNKMRNIMMTKKNLNDHCEDNGLSKKNKSEFAELLGYDLWVLVDPKSCGNGNNASVYLMCALLDGLSPFQELKGNCIVFCMNKPITTDRIWGILNFIYDAMDYYDGTLPMTPKEREEQLASDAWEYKHGKWEPRGGCGGINIYNDNAKTCKTLSF